MAEGASLKCANSHLDCALIPPSCRPTPKNFDLHMVAELPRRSCLAGLRYVGLSDVTTNGGTNPRMTLIPGTMKKAYGLGGCEGGLCRV
jgi:hypothetical protein